MASHRAQGISMLLANALAFGYAEIDPEREPLKVNLLITDSSFWLRLSPRVEFGYRHASRSARHTPPTLPWRWR